MRWLVVPACLISLWASGQSTITGRVIDAASGAPLPYCTVSRIGSTQGTITNTEGVYRMALGGAQDSLRYSYIGYVSLSLPLNEALDGTDVRLSAAPVLLAEATIRPDRTLVDRVVRANKWLRRTPGLHTRMFLALDTYCEGSPVEMIHAYFNANIIGGKLIYLGLKDGRIGLAAHEGQYFVNYSTTRAFALMDVTADESPFPTSPLKHTIPRLLRKGFIVELVSTGTGPEGVDHLRIVPRKNNPGAFTADLWLKAGGDVVRGFELHCENCAHPFRLLFDRGRLDTVDLRYRQTWSSTPVPHPEVMQLEYRMVYSGPTGTDAFATNAVMHAFDPTHSFNLPYFKYPSGVADYRKIGWLPEDTTFWQHMPAPLPTARLKRDMEFLRMHDLNRSDWREQLDDPTNFFKPPYAVWSPDRRIHINDLAGTYPSSAGHRVASGAVLPDLVAQFYLDVDTIDGILRHRSYTVADGYQTLVPSNRLPWSDCFYNIWFDLCEIRRRRLEAELDKPGTDLIRAHVLYMKHSAALRRMTRRFLEETGHGTRCEPLYRWNARVKKALGVDNIALLGM